MSTGGLLTSWGHEVKTIFNDHESLDSARSLRPDVLLLDIGMPEMNDYKVATQFLAEPDFDQLVIAALTGYGQADDQQRSLNAGSNHHLTKPAATGALAALLKSPHTYSE